MIGRPGVYRVEAVFDTRHSYGGYRDYLISEMVLMILPPGPLPCIVRPGDVDNDGIVNYADRKSLNTYIHDDVIEAGEYSYHFDGSGLASGNFFAVVTMTGKESGRDFSKAIIMAMN